MSARQKHRSGSSPDRIPTTVAHQVIRRLIDERGENGRRTFELELVASGRFTFPSAQRRVYAILNEETSWVTGAVLDEILCAVAAIHLWYEPPLAEWYTNRSCKGCGCQLEERTEGCRNCGGRHWRNKRAGRPFVDVAVCSGCGVGWDECTEGCRRCGNRERKREWKRNPGGKRVAPFVRAGGINRTVLQNGRGRVA